MEANDRTWERYWNMEFYELLMSLVNELIQHYITWNYCLNPKNYVDIAKDVNMGVGK
jgi:hypothetical protein